MLRLFLRVVNGKQMKTDKQIDINVCCEFVTEKSEEEKSLFLFKYDVSIYNNTVNNIQLLSRHWDIRDSLGRRRTINGEGVIGDKPIIKPGECFEYKSFCPLKTDFGLMKGFYTMKDINGKLFVDYTIVKNVQYLSAFGGEIGIESRILFSALRFSPTFGATINKEGEWNYYWELQFQ